jgi:hypothetical protein
METSWLYINFYIQEKILIFIFNLNFKKKKKIFHIKLQESLFLLANFIIISYKPF